MEDLENRPGVIKVIHSKPYYTVEDVMSLLGVSRSKAYKDRMAVLCWLLLNIRPAKPGAPAAYLASQDIAELASFFTGIRLNGIQVREALLLLAIAPWDADWVYRVDRDSPCAMLAPDGNGGLARTDRSCHVKSVGSS